MTANVSCSGKLLRGHKRLCPLSLLKLDRMSAAEMGCFGVPLERCLFTLLSVKLFNFLGTFHAPSPFLKTLITICLKEFGDKMIFSVSKHSKWIIYLEPKRCNQSYSIEYRVLNQMGTNEITLCGFLLHRMLCQMLKYPAASMSCCMPRLFVSVDGADVWESCSLFFFSPFQFQCFFCACCGSRTLCNAYESTPSGEVPLRRWVCRTHFRTEKQCTCERH